LDTAYTRDVPRHCWTTLFLAPFFVFMEALFHFGYRPELQKRVNEAVEKEIKKVNAEKEAKTNGAVKNGKAN
jgi:uncharacterized membrane protein YGL010W